MEVKKMVENVEGQQEVLVGVVVEESILKHRDSCKKTSRGISVNSKKRIIPVKESRDGDEQYYSEKKMKKKSVFKDGMESKGAF